MTFRQPSPDDPWWTEAPLEDVLAPLTSERVRLTEARPFYGNGRTDAAKTSRLNPGFKKKRKRLTDEKRAQIIEAIKAGRLYREIALELGVGESSVQRIAGEHGIGRGQGMNGIAGTCDRCAGPISTQNKSGTCRRCQRGKR